MTRRCSSELNGRYFVKIAGILSVMLLGLTSHVPAADINENLSIGGVMAACTSIRM